MPFYIRMKKYRRMDQAKKCKEIHLMKRLVEFIELPKFNIVNSL